LLYEFTSNTPPVEGVTSLFRLEFIQN